MSVKSEHNKTNTLIKNSNRAPIAILECLEEGLLSTESSMATNPMSRQVSLSYPANMRYRNLGKSGLRISAIGLGTWVTFGSHISEQMAEDIVSVAYENGINLFDTADVYAGGKAEMLLGRILKKKEWKRSTYNVATKLFWGARGETDRGLSRKHIIEGLQSSLERLQLSYVDIIFVNKADPMCPMEEVVRAFTHCINQGMAMYWGTSRWTAMEIMVKKNIDFILRSACIGTMTWSPQAFGMYTGKFDEGVHLLSRGSVKNYTMQDKSTCPEEGRSPRHQSKLQELSVLAEKVGCTSTQLTIAWCLKNENVHCVLVGASTPEQLYEHLHALQLLPRLTTGLINEIEKILDNKPIRVPVQR
ncbi:voltage-gated potassium channel subunit beta-1-like [Parasteatoda tepidariorum]|uniref:voltage-gated potassium channel subunit beta-1-like n=1 Tax=Parasteatoda tepidariorum TaxID=114398 RepID=UPI001C717EEA|nr:voltage-gated potassium channel subunit beta-1-like [Parasteatoda tepidariorum]